MQQIAQAAQQLSQLQKQTSNNQQQQPSQTTIPATQTTPPSNNQNPHLPASLLTPSTPGSMTPQHMKTPTGHRLLEPSVEETTDLEELEQFAKTFKQRRIKLGKKSFFLCLWAPQIVDLGLHMEQGLRH